MTRTDGPDARANATARGASPAIGTWASLDTSGSQATEHVEEMVAAWRHGEHRPAEYFLARHPELGPEAAIRLIYEEVALRQEAGLEVDPAEIAGRFPQWGEELAILLDCQRVITSGPTCASFPQVGDVLAGFRLLAELGRGAAGRVFLAAQPSLADRPVVLKVAPRGRGEHLSLARLQHMNIVPLYSEHLLQARNLQILCMPFLGGGTLSQVLELLKDQPPAQRSGRQIINALDDIQARQPVERPPDGPFRRFIVRSSYIEAICSIGACLADGLQYAHEHDLVHMDIKPSNVLLAGDCQPMLLDFHLARGPITPDGPAPTWMGGTLEFMSPEQRQALDAVRDGNPARITVDGRADIYSLGMLLYVALGGPVPASCDEVLPPLHHCNARVSVGLSDIIRRCLNHKPRDRYPEAADLAGDLRRHLAGLSLRGVPNRSWLERARKWRRRHPRALLRGVMLLILAVSFGAGAAALSLAYRHRTIDVRAAQALGRAYLDHYQYAEAAQAFRYGLALVDRLPGATQQRHSLQTDLERACSEGNRAELHRVAELIRFRYGVAAPPADDAQAIIRLGHAIWQARGSLVPPPGGQPESDLARQVRTDLLDLVLVWADVRVHYAATSGQDQARKDALRILDEAEAMLGPSPSLSRERRAHASALGQAPCGASSEAAFPTRSAWEHYDLGRSHLHSGNVELAAEQFQAGLDIKPQDFWMNFYQGLCAYRLKHHDQAVNAFRVCIALAPETAECYYNRARAYQALGEHDRSLADYDRALKLDGRLTDAALNRGIILYERARYADAIVSLELARTTASNPVALGAIHYNLALVELARGEHQAALSHIQCALSCGNQGARELARRARQ
jgi:serine/threonine protein kinase/tetratricopeptide (TPR) repeat protein